jgi:protein-S-isoprenylcysteine O-methyltransferase Ste14
MAFDGILDWLPLVIIVSMMTAAKLRAWTMQRRGKRVIIVDWQRPWTEMLYDVLIISVSVLWICLLVAEAWPLPVGWLPDWLTRRIVTARPIRLLGALMLLAAPVLFAAALRSFGDCWRIGIDRQQPPPLVTGGVFRYMRNPIYTAFDMIIIGAFLVHGRVVYMLLGLLLVLLVHGIVLREERFLLKQYGTTFQDYCRRVRRYGLLRTGASVKNEAD